MENNAVIITGSGSGIGRAIAHALAEAGAKVVVNDVSYDQSNRSKADIVASEIIEKGGEAVANTDSVSDWESAKRIVECSLDSFNALHSVINNAGIVRDKMFFNMSPEEWKSVIDVHLHGSFYVSRAAAKHFKDKKAGSYVHMTSTSGLIGNIGQANYSAAKMGIVGLSKSIAMDMARYNVRSNCIAPWAWTAMTATIPDDTEYNRSRIQKMKKMEPRKVAPLAVFLASSEAEGVSGQIFGARANELYLFNQIRMTRSVHRNEGWTPRTISEHMLPAFKPSFYDNIPSIEATPWDPI